jgi:RimJ/RimL family protein N-acetyltransferase
MELNDAFPAFGLRIEAGPLVLRPITDDVLPDLVQLALSGVHAPELMPFYVPWTDAPPTELPRNFVQYHWGLRSGWRREHWHLEFAVEWDGQLVGCQGFFADHYLVMRSGETGSWLGRAYQGRGIGTAMRRAICAFVFDHLNAEQITSAAFTDNAASNAVSRKVGYLPNGVIRMTRRDGEWQDSQQWLLTKDTFARGPEIAVAGAAEFRRFIGLEQPDAPTAQS